jgi:creatinine amidohydrolase
MRTVRFELLRPGEIIAERERRSIVYQPIGPLEWHGPHLPVGMDPLHADCVACRVAEKTGGVVMPTLYWGSERERGPEMLRHIGFQGNEWIIGMDFPANSLKSLYTVEDIFGVVVRARLDLLVRQSYRLIVLINGHGAENHMATLARLAYEFTAQTPTQVLFITAFEPDPDGTTSIGHADALETSLMMAMHPDAVDLTTLPALPEPLKNIGWGIVNGTTFAGHPNADHTLASDDDPRLNATPAAGESILERSSVWIAGMVQAAWKAIGASR